MLDFLKKLFAIGPQSDHHPLDGATRKAQELPKKFESQTVVETPEPVAATPIPSVVEKAPAKPKAAAKPKTAKAEPKAETTEKPKKTTKLKVAK